MTIWAAFVCIAAIGRCDMLPLGNEGAYRSKAECVRYLPRDARGVTFRCLGRKVEVWR